MAAAGGARAQAAEDWREDKTHEEEDPPTGGVVVFVVAVRAAVVVVDLHRRGLLLNHDSLWLLGLLVRAGHCHWLAHCHRLRHGHRYCLHRLPVRHGLLLMARHGLGVGDGRLHDPDFSPSSGGSQGNSTRITTRAFHA